MTVQEQLAEIKPGKNYPSYVSIEDMHDGKKQEIVFQLQSYFVGMYMAVSLNGKLVTQTGDHNNRGCVSNLKKDIHRAIERGASVDIGPLRLVKEKF